MPQLQVLPGVPGFGQQLGQVLGGALGNIGQGYIQHRANVSDEAILKDIQNNPNISPVELIGKIGKLSREKQQALSPLYQQHLKTQATQQAAQKKQEALEQREKQDLKNDYEEWNSTLNELEKHIPYVGQTGIPFTKSWLGSIPWSTAAEKREFFNVLAFQLERFARAAHTKGALSTRVYESLLSKIPDYKLSESKNKGRIKAWRKAIIDTPKFKEFAAEEMETQDKQSNRPPIESFG